MSEKLKCKLKIRSVTRLEPPDFNSECPDCDGLMKRIAALEAVAEAAIKVDNTGGNPDNNAEAWAASMELRKALKALCAAGYLKGEGE